MKYCEHFDTLELCERAATMLKAAGFVHYQTSMKTEAAYYRWPDRPHLLRVAAHSRKKRRTPPGGLGPVVASITFNGNIYDPPGKMNISSAKVETMVALAIGRYFLAASPKPSHARE